MPSYGMLRRVVLVRTDVSEECIAVIIRVTRIGEPATTLTVTNNRKILRRNIMHLLLVLLLLLLLLLIIIIIIIIIKI
jgi:hypothetical protein